MNQKTSVHVHCRQCRRFSFYITLKSAENNEFQTEEALIAFADDELQTVTVR